MDLLCNAYSTASDEDEDEDHHHHHSQRPMPEIPTLRPSKRPKTQNPHTTITNPLPFPTIIPQTQNEAPIPGRYISKRERAALAPRVSHPIPPSSVTSPPGFKMNRPPGPRPWSSQRGRGKGGRGPHSPSSSFKTQDKTKSFAKVLKEPAPIALRKTQQDFVIYLKDSDKRFIQNPEMIAQRYFESHIEFPQIGGKTRQYYEAILKETNSVRFMHMSRNPGSRNSEIAFSKAFILGVLSIDDWGLNPNKPQRLHNYQGEEYNYNYWDYIEAWKKAFFYQNSYNTHTWLFRFETLKEPSIVLKELPHWFFQWFILTGPEPNFFPSKLLEAFNLYTLHHPKHQKDENPIKTNILMRFLGQYDIPWIWQWSFNTASHNGLLMLVRDYFYKWWPKFEYAEIMNLIGKDIETFIEFNKQVEIEDKAQRIFKLEKTEFKTQSLASLKEKYPNTPIKELKAKIRAALTSKLDMDEDYMSTSSVQETPSQSEPEKDTHFFDIDKDDEDYSLDET